MKELPYKLKIYLAAIYVLTFFSLCYFIKDNNININLEMTLFIIFFGILMILTETYTVVYRDISFSTSFAVTVAAFILKGPVVTIIVLVIGYTFRVLKIDGKYAHILNTPWYGSAFNYCVYVLPILLGNYFFIKLHGDYGATNYDYDILAITAFCLTIFVMTVILMAVLFSIINDKNLLYYIFGNLKLGVLNFFAMAPLGLIAAYLFNLVGYKGVLLFIFPIVLARFTFSLYIESKAKYIQTVNVIMHAMEARDKYTQGHSKRVADLACVIAGQLKYDEWKLEELRVASMLHDVGKIGIDDSILNKPDKLTDEERTVIEQHPEIGYKILSDIKDMEYVNTIVKYHHERCDGKGYPEGKTDKDLSLDVFVVQLADAVDAMSTDRPYRKALSEDEILKEIIQNRGTQFHPVVVDAYLKAVGRQKEAQDYSHIQLEGGA